MHEKLIFCDKILLYGNRKRSISFNGTKASAETNRPNLVISITSLLKAVKNIKIVNEKDILKLVTGHSI